MNEISMFHDHCRDEDEVYIVYSHVICSNRLLIEEEDYQIIKAGQLVMCSMVHKPTE